MFQEIDEKLIQEVVVDLQFYDEHGCLPWEKKKVLVSLPNEKLVVLKGQNLSALISQRL